MSNAVNYRRLFTQHIHSALELLRYIFEGQKRARLIDNIYEEELIRSLSIIPEDSLESVCHGIDIVKCVYESINFTTMNEKMARLGFPIDLRIDLFKLLEEQVKIRIDDPRIQSGVSVILKKCKPILDCFSVALREPLKYLNKLGKTSDSKYDSILDDL